MIGIQFDDGILIAADQLASYGSMARFRSVSRVLRVNETTVAGCGGDYADFQYLSNIITQKQIDEECHADGHTLSPKSLFSWLTRIQYQRRSKFDPLLTTWIVGGIEAGRPFLGRVDALGTAYQDRAIATGYGAYIATPLLREWTEKRDSLTEGQARKLVEDAMRVLYCRDARSFPKYQVAVVKRDPADGSIGSTIDGPYEIDADWGLADHVCGYE